MSFKRTDQLDPYLRRVIAELLPQFFENEKYGLLTVTHIETAKNFDSARVYVSCLKNSHQFEEDASHKVYKIQKLLDAKLVMKKIPKLIFKLDRVGELTAKLEKLLAE